MRRTTLRCMVGYETAESGSGPEEPFDLLNLAPVGHEKDDVILCLDDGIVVGLKYFLATHDDVDRGAPGQRNVLHLAPHHPRITAIAVGNGLDSLGTAPSQGMNPNHA